MQHSLLTAGQFAKLARTTKRTVLWYDEQGLLQPASSGDNGYRYYEPRQIIDFQVILLLRKMRFSIEEIRQYLAKDNSLKDLFQLKQAVVKKEIADLKRMLGRVTSYYHNLDTNGTLTNPEVATIQPFTIYSITKEGQYAKIKDYCLELRSHFVRIPRNATYLTIFFSGYEPKKAKMKIGVIAQDGMTLKKEAAHVVSKEMLPRFKALKYLHKGPGTLVSLLWQELAKYMRSHDVQPDRSLPFVDLELYRTTSLNGQTDEDEMVFELLLPIKS